MSDMNLNNLFNFLSHFRGDSAKEKLEDLEKTCGDGDGTLIRSEFRKAVAENEDMIQVYGWNGERTSMRDLADIWFNKLDSIKSESKIDGTRYNNSGALSESEESNANRLAQELGFISGNTWVNQGYREDLQDADFSMIKRYKAALEKARTILSEGKYENDLKPHRGTGDEVDLAIEYVSREFVIREYTNDDIKTLESHCAVLNDVKNLRDLKTKCIGAVSNFLETYKDDPAAQQIVNEIFSDDYASCIESCDLATLNTKYNDFNSKKAKFEADLKAAKAAENAEEPQTPSGASDAGGVNNDGGEVYATKEVTYDELKADYDRIDEELTISDLRDCGSELQLIKEKFPSIYTACKDELEKELQALHKEYNPNNYSSDQGEAHAEIELAKAVKAKVKEITLAKLEELGADGVLSIQGTVEFGIKSDSTYYNKDTQTFDMYPSTNIKFNISGISQDDLGKYNFECDNSCVKYNGYGEFELTAPSSYTEEQTVTIKAKNKEGIIVGTTTFKFKVKSGKVDFKDEHIELSFRTYKANESGSEEYISKCDTSNLLNPNNHAVVYTKFYDSHDDNVSKIAGAAVDLISYNLDLLVNELKKKPGYNKDALDKARNRTVNYYKALIEGIQDSTDNWIEHKWANRGDDDTHTSIFQFEGKSYNVGLYRRTSQTDWYRGYDTNYNNDCGIQLFVDCDWGSLNEGCIGIDMAKVIQKFYEFLTGSM